MKKYLFTLGTNQALSLAELQALFPGGIGKNAVQ
jgi:hypothetical protein